MRKVMDHGKLVVGVAAVVAAAVEIVAEGYAVVGILSAVVVDIADNSVAGDIDVGCLPCYTFRGHDNWIDREDSVRQYYAPPSSL